MKVQTFLEYRIIKFAEGLISKDPVSDMFYERLPESNVMNLYMKEFEARMIPSLFNDWDEERWAGGGLLYQQDRKYRVYDTGMFYLKYEVMNTKGSLWMEKFKVLKPETVNDFISDCKRAGIELIWKEEIIKEYFS